MSGKRVAPAAERNKEPILEILREVLPQSGLVLEIASGSGQHAAFFSRALPACRWQPTDPDPTAVESIAAYREESGTGNLLSPKLLDARSPDWPVKSVDAMVCINMIHIAPWGACLGLFDGGARVLGPGAPLVLYGPFIIDGDFQAPSNIAFDQRLRGENAEWGVRELGDVRRSAETRGFAFERATARPANNHVVVFRRL